VEAGRDVTGQDLRRRFDAVLIATGAERPRDLAVPGRSLEGVVMALDYLRSRGAIDAAGLNVAVIGGGLTGEDCVEMAIAQGAKGVQQLEILPKTAVGNGGVDRHVEAANLQRHWSVAVKEFTGTAGNGRVGEIRASRVDHEPTPAGRVRKDRPGGQFSVPADLAILAIGYDAQISAALAEQFGIAADEAGRATVRDFASSVPGVFIAGDLHSGASRVADAIASGRRAAERIANYLSRRAAQPAAAEAPPADAAVGEP
jgi:glutamate synthase (NADPH/NADH) small chain